MSYSELKEYRYAETIQSVYPPILIVVGVIGNVLSIIVLCTPKNRKTSTAVFLIGLSISDMCVLIVILTEKWMLSVFDVSVRTHSNITCKVHVCLTYFLLQMSPWILVLLTTERVCCVLRPYIVKDAFTPRRAVLILISVAVILFLSNSHLMYGFRTQYSSGMNITRCYVRDEYHDFMFYVWSWLDFLLAYCIPCIILVLGNLIICFKLKSSVSFSRQCDHSEVKNTYINVKHSQMPVTRSVSSASRRKSRVERSSSFFTMTMLILNTCFVICVSPTSILTIGQPYWFPYPMSSQDVADLILISSVCFMLMYLNNAINFVLYIFLGSKFRKDLRRLFLSWFRCLNQPQRSRYENTVTSSIHN